MLTGILSFIKRRGLYAVSVILVPKPMLALLAFSFALMSQPPLAAHRQSDWSTIESPPFRIFYLASDKIYTGEITSLFQTAYLDYAAKLNLALAGPVSVFLCPTETVFNQLTGHAAPHWGEGIADPVKRIIILKSPGLTDNRRRLPKLVRHELVHVLIGQAVSEPRELPKWFNEGIASYLAADEEFAPGEAISKALVSDSIIPLDEIDDVLQFQQAKARLAYEESLSFVNFLVEHYGFRGLTALIAELVAGHTFETAFEHAFGEDIFEAELKWYSYLNKEYRWNFLIDFETFLWVFILLLFLLVFLAIRLRNRKTLKRWEEEERPAAPWS